MNSKDNLQVKISINAPLDKVWDSWVDSEDVKIWNIPFDDWHCPFVENNVVTNGSFFFRMEKKDGTEGFDYKGKYKTVIPKKSIETLQDDGRKSWIYFEKIDNRTQLTEVFEPEDKTDLKLQEEFTQSVLERFKNYVEVNKV